jgi:hypothetical protein
VQHIDDTMGGPLTFGEEWLQAAGQSVKFLNMSELLRRHHVAIIAGVQGDLLEGLAKGNKDAQKYFNKINMPAQMQVDVIKEIKAHGLYTDKWNPALADELGAILSSSIDDMAINIRKGELPALLAYSKTGKILMPFFSFTAAANQKILRQTYKADGASGIAMMMAHQAPLAMLVAAASGTLDGKEFDAQEVAKKALLIAPGIGYFSFPLSSIDRGEIGGAPTLFAVANTPTNLIGGIMEGDPNKIAKGIPFAAVALPVRILTRAMAPEDQ